MEEISQFDNDFQIIISEYGGDYHGRSLITITKKYALYFSMMTELTPRITLNIRIYTSRK